MNPCALCNQIEREKVHAHARLLCNVSSEAICQECRDSVKKDFYDSAHVTLLEVGSWTRHIYEEEFILEIAQEAIGELKGDYSQEAIEKRRKELYSSPNTHSHKDSTPEMQDKNRLN